MALYWGQYWDRLWVRRTFYTGLIIGLLAMIALSDTGIFKVVTGRDLPVSMDPLHRIRGWRETARIVSEARLNLMKEGKAVFIISPEYGATSEISFYLPEARAAATGKPIVCCWDADQPITEFHYWPGYDFWNRAGDNAIFFQVLSSNSHTGVPDPAHVPKKLQAEFRSVRSIGRFHADYRGQPMRWVEIFECRDQM